MNNETLHEISNTLRLDEGSLRVNPFEGGFTEAAKYVIDVADEDAAPTRVFAKVIDNTESTTEGSVLATEAKMYEILTGLGLTGEFFPQFMGYVESSSERALLINYLSDVTWGGPWNRENIAKLSRSISAVHNATLTEGDIENICQIAKQLRIVLERGSETNFDSDEGNRLFSTAWQPVDRSFVNSKGVRYFTVKSTTSVDKLLEADASFDEKHPANLILRDLNPGNLAIAKDRVYFVDPVYLAIGNPSFDLVVLGVNILDEQQTGVIDMELQQFVKDTFFQDKAALAHLIKYWVACTSLPPKDSQASWMNFQQSCAVTALRVWDELYG